MKKVWMLGAAAFLLSAVFLMLPAAADAFVPRVSLTRPVSVSGTAELLVNGLIEQQAQTELYPDIPLVIEEVFADAGDEVSAGQPLASVDVTATKEAVLSLLKTAEVVPKEYLEAFSEIRLDESLLSVVIPKTLNAPASGVLLSTALSPGKLLSPQSPAAVVGKGKILRVKLAVPEEMIGEVKVGDVVVFKTSATGPARHGAIVTQIAPAAEQNISGTIQQTVIYVYAVVCTDTGRLRPGYSVTASVKQQHEEENAFLVPYEAVLQDENGTEYVYLYEKNRAVRCDVTTGEEYETGIAVTAGLDGMEILVENASMISRDGMMIAWKEQG